MCNPIYNQLKPFIMVKGHNCTGCISDWIPIQCGAALKKGKSFHDYKNDLRTFTADISVLKHVEEVFIDQLIDLQLWPFTNYKWL